MFGASVQSNAALVQTQDAADFIQKASTNTGRKIMFGDREKLNSCAYNAITEAHEALAEGVKKVAALVRDPTRNDVQKHDAARQVAERVIATVERSQTALTRIASALDAEAQAGVDEAFVLRSDRGGIHDAMRSRFSEMAKRETGLTEIRSIIAKDREAAAVIVNTPAWLLGLAEEAHAAMMGDAIKRYAPKAATASIQAAALEEVAAKYPRAIAGIRRSFFNTAIADKAKSRVEV